MRPKKAVLADSPQYFWPLNEPAGSATATDLSAAENGTIGAKVTAGVPGAVPGEAGTAFRYSGTDNTSTVSTQTSRVGLNTFSSRGVVPLHFDQRRQDHRLGHEVGRDPPATPTGLVYLGRTGKVYFGVYPAAYKTVGSARRRTTTVSGTTSRPASARTG